VSLCVVYVLKSDMETFGRRSLQVRGACMFSGEMSYNLLRLCKLYCVYCIYVRRLRSQRVTLIGVTCLATWHTGSDVVGACAVVGPPRMRSAVVHYAWHVSVVILAAGGQWRELWSCASTTSARIVRLTSVSCPVSPRLASPSVVPAAGPGRTGTAWAGGGKCGRLE